MSTFTTSSARRKSPFRFDLLSEMKIHNPNLCTAAYGTTETVARRSPAEGGSSRVHAAHYRVVNTQEQVRRDMLPNHHGSLTQATEQVLESSFFRE